MVKLNVLLALMAAELALADVYMHNPRGSNDRNCEGNVNRNNGDRLFNSQNNNAGGYACPRPSGGPDIQTEAGDFTWSDGTNTYTQNKRMYYYEGSILPIEFTNQHGCGRNPTLTCSIVLQYACEDTLDPYVANFWPWTAGKYGPTAKQHYRSGVHIAAPRDGTPQNANDDATTTVGDNDADATPNTAQTRSYGMHENEDYYQICQHTERNKGLYTADQQVNRNDQRGTRQNPNGNRNGLECPEERDYYPWWAPSPWIDIAVLSDDAGSTPCYPGSTTCTARCVYYMNNTMNVAPKGYCDVNHDTEADATRKLTSTAYTQNKWYNNRKACESNSFRWYMVSHIDNINIGQNFVCARTQYSRVNQLGNAQDSSIASGNMDYSLIQSEVHAVVTKQVAANRFLWTIPSIPTAATSYFAAGMKAAYKSCVLRLRYNVSTSDFPAWPKQANSPGTTTRMVDYRNNTVNNGGPNFTPLKQNPFVYIGPGRSSTTGSEFVKLKVNTNQFGRTFQDRSYVFSIVPAPTIGAGRIEQNNNLDTPLVDNPTLAKNLGQLGKIYNLNVRGKRGNIVQTYPSVEYDFIPDQLALNVGDMVHFQWTGSDHNPQRGCNDGIGGPPDTNTYYTATNAGNNPRADRHNWMLTNYFSTYVPSDYLGYPSSSTSDYNSQYATQKANLLAKAPCNPGNGDSIGQSDCYNQITRLAHLNQQQDGASLFLRKNYACLTMTELKAIATNQGNDVADNHPLNCGKLNAKPFPYFDGGVMTMYLNGFWSYFDSRNNNFTNRVVKGILCVGGHCNLVNGTGNLDAVQPDMTGVAIVNNALSTCTSTSTMPGQGVNGVQSCIGSAGTILTTETFAGNEGDNDNKGSGTTRAGCSRLTYFLEGNSVEQQVTLAIILLFVGLFLAWAAYYMYNRMQARMSGVSKFRFDASWQTADNRELAGSAPKKEISYLKDKDADGKAVEMEAAKKNRELV